MHKPLRLLLRPKESGKKELCCCLAAACVRSGGGVAAVLRSASTGGAVLMGGGVCVTRLAATKSKDGCCVDVVEGLRSGNVWWPWDSGVVGGIGGGG